MSSATAYYSAAITAVAAAAFIGLRPVFEASLPKRLAALGTPRVFFFASVTALAIWRMPAIFLSQQIDPDESTVVALAHVAAIRPVPWLDFDATTSGPLNVWPLVALHGLGLGFTYLTARCAALALMAAALVAFYQTMKLLFGDAAARLSSVCALCFLATASYEPEIAHYTSETVSVFLLACFGLTIATLHQERSGRSIVCSAVAGALAAALPLAKLEGVPIDAALLAVTIAVTLAGGPGARRITHLVAFALGGLTVAAAVLIPVAASGAWSDFVISYVRAPLWTIHAPRVVSNFIGGIDLVMERSFFLLAFVGATVICYNGVLTLIATRTEDTSERTTYRALIAPGSAVALVLAAAIYSVTRAHERHAHHLLYILLPICATIALSFAAMTRTRRSSRFARTANVALVAALAVASVLVSVRSGNVFLSLEDDPPMLLPPGPTLFRTPAERALIASVPVGSSLSVWGWAPDAYVLRNALAGTRDATTQFQMWPGPYQRYYLERYVADLERYRPEYFLDSVRPSYAPDWTLTGGEDRLRNFAQVASYISMHYRLTREADGLKLYHRLALPRPPGELRGTGRKTEERVHPG
jgi:hypothetical protein